MSGSDVDDEISRRLRVAQEKLAGSMIEKVERMRSKPQVQSIAYRLVNSHQSLLSFRDVINVQLNSSSAHDKVDSFIKEIANYQITTYNSIIEDLHSNFDKKDSYIKSFSKMDLFDEPTISDIVVMLHKIGNNNMQILSYLIRWASA